MGLRQNFTVKQMQSCPVYLLKMAVIKVQTEFSLDYLTPEYPKKEFG